MSEPQDKAKYQEYLRSEKWQATRQRVLIRDRHVCQGCLNNRAFEVHHLHYKNIYNEFMFDLISVCTGCHERLHGIQPKAPNSRLVAALDRMEKLRAMAVAETEEAA